jgi:hypothetical protein
MAILTKKHDKFDKLTLGLPRARVPTLRGLAPLKKSANVFFNAPWPSKTMHRQGGRAGARFRSSQHGSATLGATQYRPQASGSGSALGLYFFGPESGALMLQSRKTPPDAPALPVHSISRPGGHKKYISAFFQRH